MNILLMTYGTRGDTQPFLALAQGLARAGCAARVAGPETFAPLAAQAGVDYVPLPGDPGQLAEAMTRQAGGNPIRMIGVMARFIHPLAVAAYTRLREIAPGTDAIVHSFLLTQAGYEIARALGIPDYSAQMFPMFAPTAAFPAPGFPDTFRMGFFRRWTHILSARIFRDGGSLLYASVRRGHPELPPLSGWPFSPGTGRVTPLLFGFSRHVIPHPADWPAHVYITGYWQTDPPQDSEIPVPVRRFVETGPAPVYIGFGSANPHDCRRLTEITREAIRLTGQRCILSTGRAGTTTGPESAEILAADSIPHRWLFPRMSAVVHHGGAGTTGAGLRAGIPSILVPHTADQPFWATRVRLLGAGPPAIPLRKLTAPRLAAAIDQALHDQAMRARCREIGNNIDAEDGVQEAARIIRNQAG